MNHIGNNFTFAKDYMKLKEIIDFFKPKQTSNLASGIPLGRPIERADYFAKLFADLSRNVLCRFHLLTNLPKSSYKILSEFTAELKEYWQPYCTLSTHSSTHGYHVRDQSPFPSNEDFLKNLLAPPSNLELEFWLFELVNLLEEAKLAVLSLPIAIAKINPIIELFLTPEVGHSFHEPTGKRKRVESANYEKLRNPKTMDYFQGFHDECNKAISLLKTVNVIFFDDEITAIIEDICALREHICFEKFDVYSTGFVKTLDDFNGEKLADKAIARLADLQETI